MKKISLLSLLTLVAATTFAQAVSQQEACQRAEKFLKKQVVTSPLTLTDGETTIQNLGARKAKSLKQTTSGPLPYYIYNAQDGQGYVIVSGDERAREILGYSETGSLSEDSVPDNLLFLLNGYAEEIDSLQKLPSSVSTLYKSSSNRVSISTLLPCKWNQNTPYNYYCPSGCPTGCVATAMAQILYYWGNKGYDISATDIPGYTTTKTGRVMPSLEATGFDWDLMTSTYSSYRVTESGKAVAKLMQYCGTALKMDYASGGSNAWGADQVPAMTQYFGMDKGMEYVHRPDFTFAEWDEMMYNEMVEGRPVLYGGCGYQSGWGGHAFVLDGYDASTDTYHFNFGWGGSSDGYFALTALRPSSYDFNAYVDAVIGIQPNINTGVADEPFRMSVVDITYSGLSSFTRNNRAEDFKGISIFNAIFDYMNLTLSVDLGLGLFDESGELVEMLASKHVGNYEPQDGFGLEFCFDNLAFGAELPYGTYYIKAISKASDKDEWLVNGRSDRHYIEVSLQEKSLEMKPSVELVISSFSSGTAVVRNLGTEEATSNLYIFRNNSLLTSAQEAIPADGESHSVKFQYFSGSTSNIKICSDKYGRNILYSNYSTDNVSIDGYVERCMGSAQHIDNFLQLRNPAYTDGLWSAFDARNMVVGNSLKLHLHVTNKDLSKRYNQTMQVVLYKNSTTAETSSVACDIAPGETEEYVINFNDLVYGTSYSIQVKCDGTGVITSPTGITYVPAKGVVVYTDDNQYYCILDEDLDSAELPVNTIFVDATYTDALNHLKASSNPNCIYSLTSLESVPTALGGKNIVIGDKAEKIVLYDGYSFGAPIEFTATDISYSRLMSESYSGDGVPQWGTICLPFGVERITMDGQVVDWFHGAEETGKSLWVMDFAEDDGKCNIYVNHAQTIEAYRPYLVTAASDYWGSDYQLSGKVIVFEAHDALVRPISEIAETLVNDRGVSSASRYDMVGRMREYRHRDFYMLNGCSYEYIRDVDVSKPFSAYIVDYQSGTGVVEDKLNVIVASSGEMGCPVDKDFLLGDVNFDGEVTIADVTELVNIILGKASPSLSQEGEDALVADVNGDGLITIADVTALVNLILAK